MPSGRPHEGHGAQRDLHPGEVWTATATASRGSHAGASAAASVTIANSLPVAEASVPATTAGGQDITAEVSATDADDDAVTFTWAWTRNGAATTYTGNVVPGSATARGETWEATVTPNDGEADGEPVVIHTSIGNVAPTIASVTITPDAPTTDTMLHAEVVSDDADGDTVRLHYVWSVNSAVVQDSTVSILDDALFAKHDEVSVTVTPNDGFVDGASVASDPVTILNSAPSLTAATISPASVRTADTATCNVTGWSDADGDAQNVQYQWTINGSAAASTAQLDSNLFVKGDVIACTATPFDGEAQGAAVQTGDTVVQNTAPHVASAALSTAAPHEGDTISVALTGAQDADGDPITYKYQWRVNGGPVATTPTLTSALFNKGDTIVAEVTPNDGTEDGAIVTSNTAIAANTPPVITGATLSTTSPGAGVTLSVNVTGAFDADGDAVNYFYQWYVNGAPVATTATLGPTFFGRGDTIYVIVTPNDGRADGAPVTSDTATGGNSAPTIASVTLSKTNPVEGDTLSVSINGAFDADGDPITYSYRWLVNGSAVSTASTLPSSLFAKGNTIVVEVTPNDGTVNGAKVTSNTATVQNTLPTSPVVGLTPMPTYTTSVMRCVVTTASTDADGDPITYSVAWTRQGAAYAGPTSTTTITGDTVTAPNLVKNEVWKCAITPKDPAPGVAGVSPQTTIQQLGSDGSSQANAAQTCKTLITSFPGLADGVFWLDPDGDADHSNAFQGYCDMTTDGGGWLLLAWTGNSAVTPYGVPYPGLDYCPGLGCVRGSGVPAASIAVLMDNSTEMAKAQSTATMGSFAPIRTYPYAGKYVYGNLSSIQPEYSNAACQAAGVTGTYVDLVGSPGLTGTPVYLSLGFRYATYNQSASTNTYIWNIGVPTAYCNGSGTMPGSWMGTWSPGQYGPGLCCSTGSHSAWVR